MFWKMRKEIISAKERHMSLCGMAGGIWILDIGRMNGLRIWKDDVIASSLRWPACFNTRDDTGKMRGWQLADATTNASFLPFSGRHDCAFPPMTLQA